MRILLVSTSSGSRGGGEIFLLYLGEALKAAGHEPMLWCADHPRMDELAAKFQDFGIVHRSKYKNSYYDRIGWSLGAFLDWGTSRRIATEWRLISPDVIHVNKQNLEDGLDLVRAAGWSGIPSVCVIHITQSARWLGARFGGFRDLLSTHVLRRFSGPFVTTPETRAASLRKIVGTSKAIHVIHNGVKSQVARKDARKAIRIELAIDDKMPLLISLGRMEEQKQPLEMLRLAKRCCELHPGAVKFVWVGSGSMEPVWRAKRLQMGLENDVFYVPWTDCFGDWIHASDAMLHTAKYEGMPFAILEALAGSLPVCMTRDLIKEIPPFNAQGIVPIDDDFGWLNLVIDPESRATLAAHASQLHAERFSLLRMGSDYEAVYQSLLR